MRPDGTGGRAPHLVLGIGNTLLADDGVGPALLERLHPALGSDPRVELVDGGTQGLALLGLLEGRRSLLLLDAVRLGSPPGHVHHLRTTGYHGTPRGFGAHGGNATELLGAARLLRTLPDRVELIGVEPADLVTRVGLSPEVRAALPHAARLAQDRVAALLGTGSPAGGVGCTS